jgi:hypothetical protein
VSRWPYAGVIPETTYVTGWVASRYAPERWAASGVPDRAWSPDRFLLGALGELVVAAIAGVTIDPMRLGRGCDGGSDLAGCDVKAVRPGHPLRKLAHSGTWAAWFVLVEIDLGDPYRYRLAGHASGAELQAAPLVEYGYGPTRVLAQDALHAGLPRHLEQR